ncbi:type II and III secretion system protein family protein [Solimonas sp. K1W22B-7]|uniref:type II and III secretion system protein family protein n=1 Tax=Solimonas sp. K1W22B-7 TaxID=2303331 RepID=UPI000E335705|nr:type II and III secretion system protein family protein [Solimonas sp. K1W22B-7]AXQ30768.1 type II and III secretion system protein family protein [Solimonas sp. K1W22B-7]
MKKNVLGWLAGMLVLFTSALQAAESSAPWIDVEQGFHKIIHSSTAVARVATGDPAIADVAMGGTRDVLVNGKKIGVTGVTLWKSGGGTVSYRIRVVPKTYPASKSVAADPELAQAQVTQGMGIQGKLPNLAAHRRAKAAAAVPKDGEIADGSSIQLETQVLTEVKIAEVNRTTAHKFGLNVFKNAANTAAGIGVPGSFDGIESADGNGVTFSSTSGFAPLRSAFNIVVGNPNKGLIGLLSILEGKGLARTLAEPSLMATSGQTASYLVGGEFPIPVLQSGSTSGGITVTYKEFGIRLALTPTVLARNRISLKVAPEVSDLDFTNAIRSSGVAVPSLLVRRTDTTIELGDGESFVISGLVSSNLRNNVDKVPWLGQIPVLGAFFRSSELSREEKELIMLVTPHLVRPLARGAALPPLPGSKYDSYRPTAGQAIFEETGEYDSGFGR